MAVQLYKNPLWDKICLWKEQKSESICMKDTSGRAITYAELCTHVNATAISLVEQGLKHGDRAFFLARPSIEGIVYFLAVLRAGGVVVAADVAMGREAFRSRFELVSPKWLIEEPVLYWIQSFPMVESFLRFCNVEIPDTGGVHSAKRIKVKSLHTPKLQTQEQTYEEVPTSNSEDALIVFTSGTTSLPKGVVHTFASVVATLDLTTSDLNPVESDVFYASQLYFLFIALLTGATAILPKYKKFTPNVFIDHLTSYGVTKAYALPSECEELLSYCKKNPSKTVPKTLVSLMLGSAPVLSGFLKRFKEIVPPNTEVLCIYGSTEILPMCRITMKEKLESKADGDLLGKPFTGVEIRIEDGEIIATGPNLCRQYFKDTAPMTKHHTGDLGLIDSQGRVVLIGRKKDMIIKRNYNIYPSLFESTISKIEGVQGCAMVGIYDDTVQDEKIVLFLEKMTDESDALFVKRIQKSLVGGVSSIDTYAMPDYFFCLTLPLTGRSQKVDKARLREIARTLI